MEENKNYIFISYAHKDKEMVVPIIKELQKGYNVWYDDGIDPGTEWDENIAIHIEKSSFFLALMSNNYINSSNCKDELSFARDLGKNRLIIFLEEVELPSGLKMRLNRLQNIHKYKYEEETEFFKKLYNSYGISDCVKKSVSIKEETVLIVSEEEMFNQALEVVVKYKKASISLLQRKLNIGYPRAAKLLDMMIEKGYVSEKVVNYCREVYIDKINRDKN